MAPPSELIWTILFTQKQLWNNILMETMLEEVRNSEERNARMKCMWTIYRSQHLMETTLKMDEKLGGKTQKKILHKLNKQQRER